MSPNFQGRRARVNNYMARFTDLETQFEILEYSVSYFLYHFQNFIISYKTC